ncbi:MAG: DUF58 domain-containing protein [Cyclobacteriaceae bacterium]
MKIDLGSIRKYENLELLAKELVEGFITGLHRSPYHGFSVEFAEHKLYNFGESTKNIDWKVFAKTDRLYTKQYEEETNLRCTILMDTSPSMYYPAPDNDKIRFSIYSAAALSFLMIKQRDAVGLISFADGINYQSPQKSTKIHFNNILEQMNDWLQQVPGKHSKSRVAESIHQIADSIHKRSLVIIFTDMFQQNENLNEVFEALMHLKHNKHEVLLFHVNDHASERNFEFSNKPHRFEDLESGETILLTPSEIKVDFQKRMDTFYQDIKLGCGKLKIDFIEADINQPFDKILGAYLIKRKKMM